jgi:hypothetical protein
MEANLQLAEVPSSLTQLDIILPSQHYGPQRKQAPEQRLMIAVLHDALDCLEKYRCATNSHGRRTRERSNRLPGPTSCCRRNSVNRGASRHPSNGS